MIPPEECVARYWRPALLFLFSLRWCPQLFLHARIKRERLASCEPLAASLHSDTRHRRFPDLAVHTQVHGFGRCNVVLRAVHKRSIANSFLRGLAAALLWTKSLPDLPKDLSFVNIS